DLLRGNERLTSGRVENLLAMLPRPDAHAALPRVVDQIAQVGLAPLTPEPLHQVVLESQLPREPGKLLRGGERIRSAAVQVLPDGASRPDPRRVDPLREDLRIGRLGVVVLDV